jgi:hypothetical protein
MYKHSYIYAGRLIIYKIAAGIKGWKADKDSITGPSMSAGLPNAKPHPPRVAWHLFFYYIDEQ